MDETTRTHLEFIQSNITRMNQCSFKIKGWMITIISALLALFAASKGNGQTGNTVYIFVAIVPTTIFWYLDSYYLQQERKFRGIYSAVVNPTDGIVIEKLVLPLHKFKGGKYAIFNVMFSRTEALLYLPVIFGLLIAGFCLK